MIRIIDGPAARETLALRRAPIYLRVAFNPRKKVDQWDGLDQVFDKPKPHEQLYAYMRSGKPQWMHIRGTRIVAGRWPCAEYYFLEVQPSEHVLRNTEAWQLWCLESYQRLKLPSDTTTEGDSSNGQRF